MNTKDTIAVASRSFSKNNFLVNHLNGLYSSIILNDSGKTLEGDQLVHFLQPATKAIIGIEKISDSALFQLPKLKVISKYGVGLDMIDMVLMPYLRIESISIISRPTTYLLITLSFGN